MPTERGEFEWGPLDIVGFEVLFVHDAHFDNICGFVDEILIEFGWLGGRRGFG